MWREGLQSLAKKAVLVGLLIASSAIACQVDLKAKRAINARMIEGISPAVLQELATMRKDGRAVIFGDSEYSAQNFMEEFFEVVSPQNTLMDRSQAFVVFEDLDHSYGKDLPFTSRWNRVKSAVSAYGVRYGMTLLQDLQQYDGDYSLELHQTDLDWATGAAEKILPSDIAMDLLEFEKDGHAVINKAAESVEYAMNLQS